MFPPPAGTWITTDINDYNTMEPQVAHILQTPQVAKFSHRLPQVARGQFMYIVMFFLSFFLSCYVSFIHSVILSFFLSFF